MNTPTVLMARMLVLALLAPPTLTLAAPAAAPETVGILLLRQQEESAAPLIQYCAARIPSLRRPLEAEHQKFRKKFRKATAPLRAGIAANAELSRPASRELVRDFEAMNAESLAQAQSLEPQTYCARLRDNLAKATGDSIRRNMERAFAQYTALARQGR